MSDGRICVRDVDLADRDLALRVVARGLNPASVTVAQLMTKSPDAIREAMPIEAALGRMRSGPYRRPPVVDKFGKLVGLVCLDDILDLLSEELAQVGDLIRSENPDSLARDDDD